MGTTLLICSWRGSNFFSTTQVPVGQDQAQHIEFTRECAKTFNSVHGQVFAKPEPIICRSELDKLHRKADPTLAPAKRIMSLKDPLLKMSKSEQDCRSRIHLTDSPEEISYKIRLALTDSLEGIYYDPLCRPGISNLLTIMTHLTGEGSLEALAHRHRSLSLREFKDRVATTISDHLCNFRVRYSNLMKIDNGLYLDEVAAQGARKARDQANKTLHKVQLAVGL